MFTRKSYANNLRFSPDSVEKIQPQRQVFERAVMRDGLCLFLSEEL